MPVNGRVQISAFTVNPVSAAGEQTQPCACRVCRFLLTFKNFSRGEQQEGRHSKQATDNFIHVDGAVVASTPAAGLTCKLFSSLLQLKALPN